MSLQTTRNFIKTTRNFIKERPILDVDQIRNTNVTFI